MLKSQWAASELTVEGIILDDLTCVWVFEKKICLDVVLNESGD
jgi:hypothetical protein